MVHRALLGMGLAVGQCTVSTVLYYWCATRADGGWGPGCLSGTGCLPRASMVAVGAVLLLLLSLVSGCSLMPFVRLRLGLLGTVCCFISAAPVCVGCFLPLPAVLGVPSVLPFRVVGPRSWAGSPSWSVHFWGFPLLFVLLHLFPPLRLFET